MLNNSFENSSIFCKHKSAVAWGLEALKKKRSARSSCKTVTVLYLPKYF